MNRSHTAQQADYAIKASQDAGFTNISIDLIYGIPNLSDAAWKHNLSKMAGLGIPHFSSYALTVEKGTALHHQIATKKTEPVDADQAATQFEILMEYAASTGYEHYEISNFALPNRYAIHNTNYWRGIPYLGVGPSAHSFNGVARRWNIANNALYLKNILADNKLLYEEETLTPIQQINEYIMTSLRTIWGCDLAIIARKWSDTYALQTEKASHIFQEKKWLKQNERKLILTNAGKLFADKIAGDLFVG